MRLKNQLTWALFPKPESPPKQSGRPNLVTRPAPRPTDPPLLLRLLNDPRAGWLWLLPRLWLGYHWAAAAWRQLASPTGPPTDHVLQGLWAGVELLIGLGLILGVFAGLAAFLGGLMNWNLVQAGATSLSPLLFVVTVGLILAWKVAGIVGADYFLLDWVGRPGRAAPSRAEEQIVTTG